MDLSLQLVYSHIFDHSSILGKYWPMKFVVPLCVCPVQLTCGPGSIARLISPRTRRTGVSSLPTRQCCLLASPHALTPSPNRLPQPCQLGSEDTPLRRVRGEIKQI